MRYTQCISRFFALLPMLAVGAVLLMPEAAFAQEDLRQVSGRLEENITAAKSLALSAFFFVGLVIFGIGIFLIYKDSKQPNQGHAKNGMIGMLVGALLLAIPSVVGVMGSTVLGDDQAQENITTDSGW